MCDLREIEINQYFVSEEHKYVFALLFTDNKVRMKLLGITEELYLNKDKAKLWYRNIIKKIHSDSCKITGCEEAVTKLNELYKGMGDIDE